MKCPYCQEEILPTDATGNGPETMHLECVVRMIVGSVAHQQRRCSCYGGKDLDNPALSTRQQARAAFEEFNKKEKN